MKRAPLPCNEFLKFCYRLHLTNHVTTFGKKHASFASAAISISKGLPEISQDCNKLKKITPIPASHENDTALQHDGCEKSRGRIERFPPSEHVERFPPSTMEAPDIWSSLPLAGILTTQVPLTTGVPSQILSGTVCIHQPLKFRLQ